MTIRSSILADIAGVKKRDPAARSSPEIAVVYSGLHALWLHRVAFKLWNNGHTATARIIASMSRVLTGVEIHPAAVIGNGLFIDHASGVVIGETAEVGDDVTIYQGVTLGGTSLEPGKRHPTLGDGVIVGAGAKILGPITVGARSRIGANSVVVRDVPEDAVVVGIPGQVIERSHPTAPRSDRGDEGTYAPDLVGASLNTLFRRLDELERKVTGDSIISKDVRPTDEGTWRGEDFSI